MGFRLVVFGESPYGRLIFPPTRGVRCVAVVGELWRAGISGVVIASDRHRRVRCLWCWPCVLRWPYAGLPPLARRLRPPGLHKRCGRPADLMAYCQPCPAPRQRPVPPWAASGIVPGYCRLWRSVRTALRGDCGVYQAPRVPTAVSWSPSRARRSGGAPRLVTSCTAGAVPHRIPTSACTPLSRSAGRVLGGRFSMFRSLPRLTRHPLGRCRVRLRDRA